MKLEFTIATAADAVQAADILDHIATVLESQGDTVKPTRTRRTKAQMVAETAPAVYTVELVEVPTPESETAPAVTEAGPVETAPTDLETGPVMIESIADVSDEPVTAETLAEITPAFDRATLIAEIRAACLELGSVWMRNNVLTKAAKLSALTDADLLIVRPAAAAAVVALKASQANLTA